MKTQLSNLRQSLVELVGSHPINCHCQQCEPGQTFKCNICRRLTPWCLGVDDDMEESCDDYWATAHYEVPYQSLPKLS